MMKGRKNASAEVAVIIWVAKISHIVYLTILYCFMQNLFSFLMSLLIEGLW